MERREETEKADEDEDEGEEGEEAEEGEEEDGDKADDEGEESAMTIGVEEFEMKGERGTTATAWFCFVCDDRVMPCSSCSCRKRETSDLS